MISRCGRSTRLSVQSLWRIRSSSTSIRPKSIFTVEPCLSVIPSGKFLTPPFYLPDPTIDYRLSKRNLLTLQHVRCQDNSASSARTESRPERRRLDLQRRRWCIFHTYRKIVSEDISCDSPQPTFLFHKNMRSVSRCVF